MPTLAPAQPAARPARPRTAHKATRTQSRRRSPEWLQLSFLGSLLTVGVALLVSAVFAVALGAAALVRETGEQLVAQACQVNGRARLVDPASVRAVEVLA